MEVNNSELFKGLDAFSCTIDMIKTRSICFLYFHIEVGKGVRGLPRIVAGSGTAQNLVKLAVIRSIVMRHKKAS